MYLGGIITEEKYLILIYDIKTLYRRCPQCDGGFSEVKEENLFGFT